MNLESRVKVLPVCSRCMSSICELKWHEAALTSSELNPLRECSSQVLRFCGFKGCWMQSVVKSGWVRQEYTKVTVELSKCHSVHHLLSFQDLGNWAEKGLSLSLCLANVRHVLRREPVLQSSAASLIWASGISEICCDKKHVDTNCCKFKTIRHCPIIVT